MSLNKQIRIDEAKASLEMALKMLSLVPAGKVSSADISRIQDVAGQATQAAQQLNQLIGLLLAKED